MKNERTQIIELLDNIDPAVLDYQDWLAVGMVLKDAGLSASDWDTWSRKDSARYVAGECFKKWTGFNGGPGDLVTVGTLVKLARDSGWIPPERISHELAWDAEIGPWKAGLLVIEQEWLENSDIPEPKHWNPVRDLITYLSILFQSDDHVGYVTQSWFNEKANRHLPQKGSWDRTAGQLIEALNKTKDIKDVIGDYKPEVGAWIRFNPLDGKGVRDENVTDFRYALIESDSLPLDRQYSILCELELPIAVMVHSGGKSIHAIVRVEAENLAEYKKRVNFLYDVCQRNGLKLDRQNRNPSRLSRLPGVTRNGNKQYLIATRTGKPSWKEWEEWVQDLNDDLPDPESLASVWTCMPALADPLICGLLRKGHKMLLAGPSKSGKSYALIHLCIAIAEGRTWLGWDCTKGRVLYVNLELDRPSCLNRFLDVYKALGIAPDGLENVDVWNLRGSTYPMDKLAPKLIRRAHRRNYTAIVIDPIYKVITGDENSAEQMANFCNQFDRICKELNAATIYCHHHSKGAQGQKFSRDRASGSGVFARDPDTLLDMVDLVIDDARQKQIENTIVCETIIEYLTKNHPEWPESISQDVRLNERDLLPPAAGLLGDSHKVAFPNAVFQARKRARLITGFRLEGTLREFPRFEPINVVFDYPLHRIDELDLLKDAKAVGEEPPWNDKIRNKKRAIEDKQKGISEALENAFEACNSTGKVTIRDLAEYTGKSEKQIRRNVKNHPDFECIDGEVIRKEE